MVGTQLIRKDKHIACGDDSSWSNDGSPCLDRTPLNINIIDSKFLEEVIKLIEYQGAGN